MIDDEPKAVRKIKEIFSDDPPKLAIKLAAVRKHLTIIEPIVKELHGLGFSIETLDDLRHLGKPWQAALPVLLRWLPRTDDADVKEDIVRCLSVPWIGNKATPLLIEEFQKAAICQPGLAWTIGNALSIVEVTSCEKQIVALCMNKEYGTARQMLVLGLGRSQQFEAENSAMILLSDNDVSLHAIIALGDMRSKASLPALEKFLVDKKALIRKEARRSIAKITRTNHPRKRGVGD